MSINYFSFSKCPSNFSILQYYTKCIMVCIINLEYVIQFLSIYFFIFLLQQTPKDQIFFCYNRNFENLNKTNLKTLIQINNLQKRKRKLYYRYSTIFF